MTIIVEEEPSHQCNGKLVEVREPTNADSAHPTQRFELREYCNHCHFAGCSRLDDLAFPGLTGYFENIESCASRAFVVCIAPPAQSIRSVAEQANGSTFTAVPSVAPCDFDVASVEGQVVGAVFAVDHFAPEHDPNEFITEPQDGGETTATALLAWTSISSVAVLPQFQGRGLGRWMLNLILERTEALVRETLSAAMDAATLGGRMRLNGWYPADRICRVALQVDVDNTGAQMLYRSLGFHASQRLTNYYTDIGHDAYTMIRLKSVASSSPHPQLFSTHATQRRSTPRPALQLPQETEMVTLPPAGSGITVALH